MGAFCVFGISRMNCRATAERTLPSHEYFGKERQELTMAEWCVKRDALAEKLWAETEKIVRISPEFDAPQFCHDWMAAGTGQIRSAKIMVRGPKLDKGGGSRKAQRRRVHDMARVHRHQPVCGAGL